MSKKGKNIILIILSILILLVSIYPLLRNDYIRTHDLNLYPTWLYEFNKGIKDGMFLPRWSQDFWLGFGSPIFNFIQPLFYYISELFYLVGFSLVNSVKITIGLSFIWGFIFMFLFGKAVWDKWGGFLAAVIYTFFPYRLGLVYIRGDFGEFLATSFIPLVLFSFLKLGQTRKIVYFLLSSLSLALLFLSHNLQALIFIPILLIYLLVIFWKNIKKIIFPVFLSGLFALGIASFFTLPAFWEKKFFNSSLLLTGKYDFHNHFLNIGDLILPRWDSYSFFQIGAVGIVILFLTGYLLVKKVSFDIFSKKNIYFFLILVIACLLATLSVSAIFWGLPLFRYIQFPWRALSFLALGFGILGGILFRSEIVGIFFKKKLSKIKLAFIFSIIIVLANLIFVQPVSYLKIEKDELYNPILQLFSKVNLQRNVFSENVLDVNVYSITPEFLPKGMDTKALKKEMQRLIDQKLVSGEQIPKIYVIEGKTDGNITDMDSYHYNIKFQSERESLVRLNTIWFPGWRAYLDGKEIAIKHDNDFQAMMFTIPSGNHNLQVKFQNTPVRTIGNAVSLISVILWLIILIVTILRKKIFKKSVKLYGKTY